MNTTLPTREATYAGSAMHPPARPRPAVLVVDDDGGLSELMAMRLTAEGFDVTTAESGDAALARLEVSLPEVVVADLRMPGMDGLALFDAIRRTAPTLPVIIITAHGTIPEAVDATRRGVFAFLTKPVEPATLIAAIRSACRLYPDALQPEGDWPAGFITRSPRMQEVLAQARRIASTDSNVCVVGASGTGKKMLARALYRASAPEAEAFVEVNCAAVLGPEFGERLAELRPERASRLGELRWARRAGVLFLDGLDKLSPGLQAVLLREVEEAAGKSDRASFRILCTTDRSLEDRVAERAFREDLHYRLNVVRLVLPALDERREDIPLLANLFLSRLAEHGSRPGLVFARGALEWLSAADWPGNLHQLRNTVEQAVALSATDLIAESLVRNAHGSTEASLPSLDQARRAFERDYLARVLKVTGGNVSRAARLAGRNRTEFYRLLERRALRPGMFKEQAAAGS